MFPHTGNGVTHAVVQKSKYRVFPDLYVRCVDAARPFEKQKRTDSSRQLRSSPVVGALEAHTVPEEPPWVLSPPWAPIRRTMEGCPGIRHLPLQHFSQADVLLKAHALMKIKVLTK